MSTTHGTAGSLIPSRLVGTDADDATDLMRDVTLYKTLQPMVKIRRVEVKGKQRGCPECGKPGPWAVCGGCQRLLKTFAAVKNVKAVLAWARGEA